MTAGSLDQYGFAVLLIRKELVDSADVELDIFEWCLPGRLALNNQMQAGLGIQLVDLMILSRGH